MSPVTGALDAFEWKVPPEPKQGSEAALALKKIEELVVLGSRPDEGPLGRTSTGTDVALRPGLRVRTPDTDRPITVEIEPVRAGDELPDNASPVTVAPNADEQARKASA